MVSGSTFGSLSSHQSSHIAAGKGKLCPKERERPWEKQEGQPLAPSEPGMVKDKGKSGKLLRS